MLARLVAASALILVLGACGGSDEPTKPPVVTERPIVTTPPAVATTKPAGRSQARLIEEGCAGTTYTRCRQNMPLAIEGWPGSLIAVCEYADGEGDIVIIESRAEAEATCSADGLFSPSKVAAIVQLP